MADSRKLVIIGAGHVGSHCAQALAWAQAAEDIVLVDRLGDKAKAQALDISDTLSFPPRRGRIRAGDYAEAADADIVIIAIGEAWRPGQTRLDLLADSVRMLDELMAALLPLRIQGLVITITNPADIVADYTRRALGLPRSRCFGTGTLLDTARLVRILSERTGLHRSKIEALVLGEHGDSSVPAFSQLRLDGKGMAAYARLKREELTALTRQAGMDVVIGKGSTEFGIGQATATLCAAILDDTSLDDTSLDDTSLDDAKAVFPLSAALEGEYGQMGIHAGVPCRIGRRGIEEILELELDPDERAAFGASCDIIREYSARARAK